MEQAVVCRMARNEVDRWWPLVANFVSSALEHSKGEISPAGVREAVRRGTMQMWLVLNIEPEPPEVLAGCVTQIVDYESMSTLRIVILGGSRLNDWADKLIAVLDAFGKEQGVTYMEAIGRRGFERKIHRFGFKPTYVVFFRSLNNGQDGRNDQDDQRNQATA